MRRLVVALGLVAGAAALFALFLQLHGIRLVFSADARPPSGSRGMAWTSARNLVQEGNTCSAHAIVAVLFAETGRTENPYTIYDAIKEKLSNGYVYPWGITRYLARCGLAYECCCLNFMSDEKQSLWLTAKLAEGAPVIVIVGNRRSLHYITVLGMDDHNAVHCYDSLMREDFNGDDPGNVSVSMDIVVESMSRARFRGLPLHMVIAERSQRTDP